VATIHHEVLIDAPIAQVYAAIATPEGIGTWWDKQTPTQLKVLRTLIEAEYP
jgi:uncharacterized protein YndB with AHSA1/START domain